MTDKQYFEPRRHGFASTLLWWFFLLAMSLSFLLLTADHFKVIPQAWIDAVLGKERATFSTPPQSDTGAPLAPPVQQPISAGGGAAPWPTLTPTAAEIQPTLTIPPAPTATAGFWTSEEQTQIAATATAFIADVPTAPPAFVEYADEKCRDPELVAASVTLQLFCKK